MATDRNVIKYYSQVYITANPEVEKHTQVRLMLLCIRNIDICRHPL